MLVFPFMEELSVGISFGSINTGLPKDIVKQIIAAEKIPIQKMEERKGKIDEKKGLVQELVTRMEAVRGDLAKNANARALRELKATYNEDIVDVTVDKNIARPGSYQMEVVSLAQKSSAMSSGFANPDDSYVGGGFLQYSLPNGEVKDIYIDSSNSSLNSIAKLINRDSSTGLQASVINDGSGSDTPWRLLLSLEKTGDEQLAEFPYFYFVDGEQDFYLEFEREAHDAVVKMDGFEIELPENKANELIPGLAIALKKAKPGEEFTIKVSEDTEAVTTKVKDLIDNLNNVLRFIKEQNNIDQNTDTSKTLGGDIILQTLESRLRTTIFKDIRTEFGFKRFGDLGVTFQRDGLLKLDEEKFKVKIEKNYNEVSQILKGYLDEEGNKFPGFMDHLDEAVDNSLRSPDGLLSSRKKSLQSNIDQIDRRIAQRERMINQKEKNLKDKFARLEGTIAKIKNQGAGIASLGAQANDPVTQLG